MAASSALHSEAALTAQEVQKQLEFEDFGRVGGCLLVWINQDRAWVLMFVRQLPK